MAKGRVIAGIDVGSAKIATIIAQANPENDSLNILGVSWVPTPPDGVKAGQIVDIERATVSIIASVEKAERMAGFAVSDVVAVINGGHIQGQNSRGVVAVASPDGEIDRNDIDRVIDAARALSLPQTREIIHVLPREFIVDGESGIKDPIGMSGVRLEVDAHIVTASSTAIKNLTKCVSEVGAKISGVVFSAFASSEAVLSSTERELGVVLVDIGAGTTSIAVFSEGALSHSRVLPIGAKNITNDLAIGIRTSLESAEKIKLKLSEPKKKDDEDEISVDLTGDEDGPRTVSKKTIADGIIKPRLNEIWTMVGMELKSAGLGGRTPAGVVLTGGGAMTVGAQDSARRILALPVRIGTPGVGLSGLIDDIASPAYSSTVGSVLWASRNMPEVSTFSLGGITRTFEGIPVKGVVGKIVDTIRGLLP
ncbi:cell division protein FtsA [Candidatus Microgenomates bacterium]|nr:cell division protein FtsA [Candidatus Microgenomates bacterium]